MSKIKEIKINRFDGGISDDIREPSVSKFSVTKHFDIWTNPYRLTPNRDQEDDMNDGSTSTGMKTYKVTDIIAGSDGKLYASGQNQPTNAKTKIFYKADPTDGNWTVPASATGSGTQIPGCFVEYENYFWGFQGTNQIYKYGDITGAPTITDTVASVGTTIASVAQGIVTQRELFMFYNNIVVKVTTGGSVTDAAFTVDPSLKITSCDVYGNYLAIGCAPKNTTSFGRSVVYLWDRSTTLIASEIVDWGEGALYILGNVEGRLIGVTNKYLDNSLGLRSGAMVIREWAGGASNVVKEVVTNNTTASFPKWKFVRNNKLFWSANIPTADVTSLSGIFCYGRRNSGLPFALTLAYIQENADSFGIRGFGMVGNYVFIVYSTDFSISKSNDQSSYTFTSIYESQKLTGGDIDAGKKMRSVAVTFAPLPTAGSVTLKYRKDEETSYTTIFTESTDNAITHVGTNIESTNAPLPIFNEIQFRIESTGGAEITGLKFTYEEMEDLYV